MINLKQKELHEWQKRNFGTHSDDALKCAVGMSEEVGEVCHHVLKGTQRIRGGFDGIDKEEVADGVADTLIYGLQLLSTLGIDAEVEIASVIEKILDRNWVKQPTGAHVGGDFVCKKCGTAPGNVKLYIKGEVVPRLEKRDNAAGFGGSFSDLLSLSASNELVADKYYNVSAFASPDIESLRRFKESEESLESSLSERAAEGSTMARICINEKVLGRASGCQVDSLRYIADRDHLDCVCECGYSWQELPLDEE